VPLTKYRIIVEKEFFLASEILSIPFFPKIVFGTLWADISGTVETKYDKSTVS
jgi:hypothetical protein